MSRFVIAAAALGIGSGCAFHNPATTAGMDAQDDAAIDSPLDPCTLDAIDLNASTLAGCASAGTMDGVRGVARFSNPVNLALGPSGIAYVADFDSSRLRKVELDGTTTTFVNRPDLIRPFGMLLTPDGYLYVQTDDDGDAHSVDDGMIWKVNPATGDASVILRDHGRTRGLALLPDGTLATADYVHHVIEIVDPLTGVVTTLAGVRDVYGHTNATNGLTATFNQPWDLVVDSNGDLIVSEFENNDLRRVTLAGAVSDYAGSPAGTSGHMDGALAGTMFFNPKGLTTDASGAIYVSEAGNHDIRKIASGTVTTIAGVIAGGYQDSTDPMQAAYYGVEGLDVSPDGTRIVIADGNNGDGMPFNHVRELKQ